MIRTLFFNNIMDSKVGISEIGVVIPDYFMGTEKISQIQNLPLSYISDGLGVIQSRISYKTSLEDLVFQAVKKINYRDVERFIIASESDHDLSKASIAINSINERLGLKVVPFQLKFACLAGVQALLSACEYAVAHDKPAIVIAADRSFYEEDKAGTTQGAGVVALRVEKNPKLLEIDFKNYGEYAENIDDFKIPAMSAPFPKVDAQLTKVAYMKCVLEALKDYKNKSLKDESIIKSFNYFTIHSPFPKMVLWASAALWRFENSEGKCFNGLLDNNINSPGLFRKIKELFDEVRSSIKFKEFFDKKVKNSLVYNPYIGNCYTASIFISLISVLERAEAGENVCIVGYGSGSGSLVVSGEVKNSNFKSDLSEQLKNGQEITESQYKEWRESIIKKFRES